MPFGTANGRLKKMVLFDLLKRHGENVCFRCKRNIETPEELSIEHKEPWLDNDVDLFWNLNNIAFAHLSCNIKAKPTPPIKHGTIRAYISRGCRCEECTEAKRIHMSNYRERKNYQRGYK